MDFEIEKKKRNLKTTAIPTVIGALGTLKKGANKCINKISDNPCLQEIKRMWNNCSAQEILST